MEHLFAHNGQLTDLTIDRLLTGELSDDEAARVQAHLTDHPDEAARVEAIREEVAAPLPPLRAPTLLGRDGRLSDLTIDRLLTEDLSPLDARLVQRHLDDHPDEAARVEAARAAVAAPLPPLRLPTFLGRDGRLTDLTIDRLLTDDLSDDEAARIQAHLDKNPDEASRVASVRASVAAPLPPLQRRPQLRLVKTPPELREATAPPPEPEEDTSREEDTEEAPSNVLSFPGRSWGPAALLLAAAAAFLLVVVPNLDTTGGSTDPGTPYDTVAFRGGIAMNVVRDGGSGGDELLESGAVVSAGDQLGFQAGAEKDGYLLIMGIDGAGETYAAYPSQPGAAAVFKQSKLQTLGAAIQLDGTPGTDRLVGVFCEAPFSYDDIAAPLKAAAAAAGPSEELAPLRAGCKQKEVRLQKAPKP